MWLPPDFFLLVSHDWATLLFAQRNSLNDVVFVLLLGGGAFLGGRELELLLPSPCTEGMLL